MNPETNKRLDRARRLLEKKQLREAIAEYEAVLAAVPGHQESVMALADLFTRLNDPARASQFYGMQFDRLVDSGDSAMAAAIFTRHLKPFPQPANRLVRYAFLLQKQNKSAEAIEWYAASAARFREQNDTAAELDCLQKIAQLDPENPQRQIELAILAEALGSAELASRAYLRAAQLTQVGGDAERALDLFDSAHRLSPKDRSVVLLYAEARLRRGDAAAAVGLLNSFAPPDPADTAFLGVFGEALLRTGELDRAREPLLTFYRQKPDSSERLFELAGAYFKSGADDEGAALLTQLKEWMFAARQENLFASQVDRLAEGYPGSLPLAEFWSGLYEQLNREAKYFDTLVRLFDLYLPKGKIAEACEMLDRLVEIDPYDYRIHERIGKLEGKATPAYLRSINSRAAKAAGGSSESERQVLGGAAAPASDEERAVRALDDLIVQAEIFLQYSLQNKAVERLERIAELFPGEEQANERLRALYDRANWWPKGAGQRPRSAVSAATVGAGSAVETHRDLAQIAEITRLMYREVTPREVLASAVREIGKYLNVRRCLAVIGPLGEPPQLTAEFAAPGLEPAGGTLTASLIAALEKARPDALGGIVLRADDVAALRELGLATALAVPLTDKDTQAAAGKLLVGDGGARAWKPNEGFFLQAVGDQVMISVNHSRLRSLVRTLAVADEKTGLLSRGAYVDCLLAESKRSRTQGTSLALVILQLDRGPELLRQEGDAAIEAHMNQLARALESCVRQGDLGVKYTAWSLAFVLPDTSTEKAAQLAEKLRQAASRVQPAWAASPLTLSAVVADAAGRPADENEDRVTEWINRAESGLDEARQRGGNAIVSVAAPQVS